MPLSWVISSPRTHGSEGKGHYCRQCATMSATRDSRREVARVGIFLTMPPNARAAKIPLARRRVNHGGENGATTLAHYLR